eukprot:85748_1
MNLFQVKSNGKSLNKKNNPHSDGLINVIPINPKSNTLKIFSQLINMGFDEKLSINAAKTYPNDLNKAINLASNDPLLLKENSSCQKMISTYGDNYPKKEYVILSSKVTKINNKGNEQKRIILLTDKALYNLKQYKMHSCQRRIDFNLIKSILIPSNSKKNEFIIHVPTEHDYHYAANQSDKIRILCVLSKLCNITVHKIGTTKTIDITAEFSQHYSHSAMAELNKKIVTPKIAQITLSQKHITQISETFSKWTDHKDNLLVYGYIRKHTFRIYKLNIPFHIMDYCLLYLSVKYDLFDVQNIWKEDDFISISEDKKILSVGKNHLLKQTVYGMYSVNCQHDSNLKTLMWKVRINRIKKDSIIYIGIGNKVEKTIMYKAGRSSFKSCSIFKHNQNIGGMLHQFERGDYIDVILDMVTHKLIFLINCDTQHMIKNIKCYGDENYQLAVFLSHVQVELKDFTVFNGSWNGYKQSQNVNIEYKTKYFC